VNSTGGGESGTLVTEAWDEVFEAMEERLKETTLAGIAAKRVIDFSI
jgi:DNA-binding IscR family transcriptional regulator